MQITLFASKPAGFVRKDLQRSCWRIQELYCPGARASVSRDNPDEMARALALVCLNRDFDQAIHVAINLRSFEFSGFRDAENVA